MNEAEGGPEPTIDRNARTQLALALTIALLVASNVIANVVLPSGWYVPWNLGVAVALVGLATGVGRLSLAEIGLGTAEARSGLRLGGGVGGAIAATILLAAALPATRSWFEDDIGNSGTAGLLLRVFVIIPFGTVALEEIAFRGCLPALFGTRAGWSTIRSACASAVLFGLWHVLPSRGLGGRNAAMGSVFSGALSRWAPIAAAVVATGVAGLGFMWMRVRSDSVIAPMVVHYSLNASATLAAWLVAT